MSTSPPRIADDEGLLAAPTLVLLRHIGQVLPLAQDFEEASREVLGMLAGVIPADAFALAVLAEDEPLIFTFAPEALGQQVTAQIGEQFSEAADLVLGRKLPSATQIRFQPIAAGSAEVADIRSHVVLPLTSPDLDTPILGGMFSGKAGVFKASHVALFSTVAVNLASFYLACLVRDREKELQRRQSEFVATASHELRTPLHSIRGFTRLLLDGRAHEPETVREFLTIIDDQSEQLARLVSNLLDVSKIEAGRMETGKEPLSLHDLVGRTVAQLGAAAKNKAVSIKTDLPADLPHVEGDREQFVRVLTNLVGNAIKFSEAPGTVTIRGRGKGPELVVSVQDQGIGIPKEALPHLFERFYQVNSSSTRQAGGTGLGLYISRQIVEAHGGRIWVDSKVGEGSTFSFAIPVSVPDSEDMRTAKAA